MRGFLRTTCICLAALGMAAPLYALDRFPRPEFDGPYEMPGTTSPQPRADFWEYYDVAVLALALIMAAYLALKRRSRAWLYALMVFSLVYFGFWRRGCVCAVGSVQNVTLALFDATYAIPLTVVAFFLLPLVTSLLFGRVFCAAVCPLGAVQDVVALRPVTVPTWLEGALGMIPYVYLAAAVLFAAAGAGFLICEFDPFVSLFRTSGTAVMLVLGALVLLAGVFVARPYCRFACPYGVLLHWMSRLSQWHLGITPDECVKCRLCEESCPFGAIRRPTPEKAGETRRKGVRRLGLLIVLLPLLILAGGWTGRLAGAPLSRGHRTVQLAEQVGMEQAGLTSQTTLESEAFVQTGKPVRELHAEALAVRERFRFGAAVLGGFLGLAFGLKLVGLSIRRRREDYEPDRGRCLSCGRCFDYCPREHLRRKDPAEQDR